MVGEMKNSTWYYRPYENHDTLDNRDWVTISVFSQHLNDLTLMDRKCYYDTKWHSLRNLISG